MIAGGSKIEADHPRHGSRKEQFCRTPASGRATPDLRREPDKHRRASLQHRHHHSAQSGSFLDAELAPKGVPLARRLTGVPPREILESKTESRVNQFVRAAEGSAIANGGRLSLKFHERQISSRTPNVKLVFMTRLSINMSKKKSIDRKQNTLFTEQSNLNFLSEKKYPIRIRFLILISLTIASWAIVLLFGYGLHELIKSIVFT
jgi:hypothetical protein